MKKEKDKIIEEANVELDVVSELVNKLINNNSKITQDQEKKRNNPCYVS